MRLSLVSRRHFGYSYARLLGPALVAPALVALALLPGWAKADPAPGTPQPPAAPDAAGKGKSSKQIVLDTAEKGIANKSFTFAPIASLEVRNYPADGPYGQVWTFEQKEVEIGKNKVSFPVMAMVEGSRGVYTLFPAELKAKVNLKPGKWIDSDGYDIQVTKAVKAGDSVPILMINGSAVSFEGVETATKNTAPRPWLIVSNIGTKEQEIEPLLEIRWLARNHAGLPEANPRQLYWAADLNEVATIKSTLEKSPALVSQKDTLQGWTPLHYAAAGGKVDAIKELLAHKADINAKSKDGKTPMAVADEHGWHEAVDLLRSNGGK